MTATRTQPQPGPRTLSIRTVIRGAIVVATLAIMAFAYWWFRDRAGHQADGRPRTQPGTPAARARDGETGIGDPPGPILLDAEQQRAIGLKTVKALLEPRRDFITAPGASRSQRDPVRLHHAAGGRGRPVGDGPRRARRSRRATCWRRSTARMSARPGSSSTPGSRRSSSRTPRRTGRRRSIGNTLDLARTLRKRGETPEQIHEAFADRAVGENREKLMTAYAQYRLAVATMERNRELHAQKLITPKQFQQVTAEYEVAQADLPEPDGPDGLRRAGWRTPGPSRPGSRPRPRSGPPRSGCGSSGSSPTGPSRRSQRRQGPRGQARRDARRAADGEGRAPVAEKPETVLPPEKQRGTGRRAGRRPARRPRRRRQDAPVSTYSIWAPFDGTILDREMIVPGVAVDTTHRIFTLANLSTVWVEANVHEQRLRHAGRGAGARRSGSGRRPTPAACSRAR